jgi:hypothetical protein
MAILSLLVPIVCQPGCARTRPVVASLWQQVPPVRWPGRESESEKPERVSEPAVAANVALKADDETATAGIAAIDAKSKSVSGSLGFRLNSPESRTEDTPNTSEFGESRESVSQDSDLLNSPLDRLNAALSDDNQQGLPQRSLTMLEERIRMDSLITRARELMDLGQLEQARDAALAAQELGENAQLEYSPDEDRPIDLVRRIEGRLEATRLTQEASQESESSASVSLPNESDSSPVSTAPVDPTDKDAKGISRKQRTWSTLFRREKKPNSQPTADPITQSSNRVTSKSPQEWGNVPSSTIRSKSSETHDAIVMANRSISLGSPEASSESDGTFVRPNELMRTDRDSSNSQAPSLSEPDDSEKEDGPASSLVVSAEASIPTPPDDGSAVLPDLEAEEIAPVPRRVKSSNVREDRPEIIDVADTEHQSDWTYLYIAIGIVSVFAFVCYRRGAT